MYPQTSRRINLIRIYRAMLHTSCNGELPRSARAVARAAAVGSARGSAEYTLESSMESSLMESSMEEHSLKKSKKNQTARSFMSVFNFQFSPFRHNKKLVTCCCVVVTDPYTSRIFSDIIDLPRRHNFLKNFLRHY